MSVIPKVSAALHKLVSPIGGRASSASGQADTSKKDSESNGENSPQNSNDSPQSEHQARQDSSHPPHLTVLEGGKQDGPRLESAPPPFTAQELSAKEETGPFMQLVQLISNRPKNLFPKLGGRLYKGGSSNQEKSARSKKGVLIDTKAD